MYAESTSLLYIDPNTSQHVFSLLGPILVFLGAMGGLAAAGFVVVRRRIVSYFQRASWAKRIVTLSAALGMSALVFRIAWGLLG